MTRSRAAGWSPARTRARQPTKSKGSSSASEDIGRWKSRHTREARRPNGGRGYGFRPEKRCGGAASGFTPTQFNQLAGYTDGTKTVSFTYDRSGNRLTRAAAGQTDTYAYDAENRLVTLSKSTTDTGTAGTFTYSYDYRTRRVERVETITGTTSTTAIVFSGGTSAQEYTGTVTTSNLTAQYVRGSDWGGGVGGLLYSVRGGTPSFKHYDSRGDVIAESDTSGASTWRAQYDAYGTRSVLRQRVWGQREGVMCELSTKAMTKLKRAGRGS